MKFTADRIAMANAAKLAAEAAGSRPTNPLFFNLRIDAAKKTGVRISATDLDIRYETTIAESDVSKPGTVLAPAKLLAKLLSDIKADHVEMALKDTTLTVKAAGQVYDFATADPADWPHIDDDPPAPFVTVAAKDLAAALKAIEPFPSAVKGEYAFNSVNIVPGPHAASLFGTNGRFMRHFKIEAVLSPDFILPLAFQVLIPPRLTSLVARLCDDGDVKISLFENKTVFCAGAAVLSGLSVYGKYPDIGSFLATRIDDPGRFTVRREDFVDAITLASHMAADEGSTAGIRFELTKDLATLRSAAPGRGTAAVPVNVSYTGDETRFGLAGDYLLKILHTFAADEVTVTFIDKDNSFVVHAGDPGNNIAMVAPIEV